MSGTIPLSLSQRFDNVTHLPLNGGRLYIYKAGTVAEPQNAFQDSALTIPWPNPLTLDEGGNIPQLFLADGQVKVRLTNSAGVNQLSVDGIQVVGASSGGGGGGTVDATTVLSTGDVKMRYGTGSLSGFVRMNGRTIGSATSGATERANADSQALFEFLWNNDTLASVSGGRGVTSLSDWAANKTITLPDSRSRMLAALGDMGNTPSNLMNGASFNTGNYLTLGSVSGVVFRSILLGNLPAATLAGTVSGISATGFVPYRTYGNAGFGASISGPNSAATYDFGAANTATVTVNIANVGGVQGAASVPLGGSGIAVETTPPLILVTIYIKL